MPSKIFCWALKVDLFLKTFGIVYGCSCSYGCGLSIATFKEKLILLVLLLMYLNIFLLDMVYIEFK